VPPSAPAAPVAAALQDAVQRMAEEMQTRCRKAMAKPAPSVHKGNGAASEPVIRKNGHDHSAARHGERSMQKIIEMHTKRDGTRA
jgi:hypothetical protein